VLLPYTTAGDLLGIRAPTKVLIRTDLGAAPLIARQVPVALSPNGHDSLHVVAPPDPASLRGGVEPDINGLFVVLGLVSLIVGAIGIANVTLVTVMERIGETGLRRALGTGRRHIAAQFLVEIRHGRPDRWRRRHQHGHRRGRGDLRDQRLDTGGGPVAGRGRTGGRRRRGTRRGPLPALQAARMQPVDALRSGT
jgi:putative ABC transport system permease protein